VNSHLINRGIPKIDFLKVKTIIDLRDPSFGLTFDVLLDAMNQIRLKDDQPLETSKLEERQETTQE